MLILHGDADNVVPYDAASPPPGRSRPLPAREAARFWARANECAMLEAERDTIASGRVLRDTWQARCRAPVVFLTVRGGDHGWPRGGNGAGFDATDVIWEFFSRQAALGGPPAHRTARNPRPSHCSSSGSSAIASPATTTQVLIGFSPSGAKGSTCGEPSAA